MREIRIKYIPETLSIICTLLLFIAVLHLPLAYYRFLRVVVFIGALIVILRNRENWIFWSMLFAGIAILFNPILPIYLYKRSVWAPLDIIIGVLFLLELFLAKTKKNTDTPENTKPKEEKTYHRDRIL